MMSTELATIPDHEAWMRVYEPMIGLAERLAFTAFVPEPVRRAKNGAPRERAEVVADTFAILLCGHGIGLSPIQALQSIAMINGKPFVLTEVVLALALRAGHHVQFVQTTDKSCTVRGCRKGTTEPTELTYTIAQATAAGLIDKDSWKKRPAEMLRARAARALLKMIAPEVALGLETAESPATALVEAPAGGTTVVQITPDPPEAITMQTGGHNPVAPDTEPEPLPVPAIEPPATSAQLRKLNAQLSELEKLDGAVMSREDRRDMIGALAGVQEPLVSAKDLTQAQASRAIEALQALLDAAVPPFEEPLP